MTTRRDKMRNSGARHYGTPIRRRSSGCGWLALLGAVLLGVVIGLALLATATTD